MADFISPTQNLWLTEPSEVPKSPASTTTVKDRKADLSFSTGMTKEEVNSSTDESGKPLQPVQYRGVGDSRLYQKIQDGATLQELQTISDKEDAVKTALTRMEDLSAVDVATANDDSVSAKMWKTNRRLDSLSTRLMDHVEESNGGIVDTVFEFIDQVAYDTFTGIRDIPQEITGGGTEATSESQEIMLAVSSMTDEEFAVWADEFVDSVKSKGLAENIGGESGWAAYRALAAVDNAGVVVNDEYWGYFGAVSGAVDVLTLGMSGVSKIAKVGRSLVGRLRNTAGAELATEAAKGTSLVLRSGLDGEIVEDLAIEGPKTVSKETTHFGGRVKNMDAIEDAEVVEDIIPEAYASKLKAKEAPPVSTADVSKTWKENFFKSQFLKREKNMSFGASTIGQASRQWAFDNARKLAEASTSRMMSFDVVDEGLQNFKSTVTFGKHDGKAFESFFAAKKESSKFPNSVVIDARTNKIATADTGSGQYIIRSETRVPYSEVAAPMDIVTTPAKGGISGLMYKAHTSRIGRFFAASHYGTSSYLSNLADAAEFGHLGFHKDVEGAFKQINKLGKAELQSMNKVLTTLRDAPVKGTSKNWLSQKDFIRNYTAVHGSPPSLEVLKAYEHVIAMSDFSWYVMASDRLRVMANQKASIVSIEGADKIVFPTTKTVKDLKNSKATIWLTDARTGKRISAAKLSDDQTIMAFGHRQGDYSDYVVNFEGKTRLPALDDAYPYNAGGPRSNPDLAYFVGDTTNGWATLIGARSNKDAQTAVKQFNTVSVELQKIFGDEIPDNFLTKLSTSEKKRLDALVIANNDWKSDMDGIKSFITFSKERGVNATKQIFAKERNMKLATFKELGDGINDPHLLDMTVEKYSNYHRHDIALREFGGELASNPDPVIAVSHQFNHMINRAAQTQYRMEASTSWVKAVEKAAKDGHISAPEIPLAPMTDEAKIRNYKITGNTPTAVKLRKEQDVIQRRLAMYDGMAPTVADSFSKINQTAFEAIWDRSKLGGKLYQNTFGKLDKTGQTLMSLGFFQKMSDPGQILLQAAHSINVSAISPKNGLRGVTMASYMRQAAREGNESLWAALGGRLRKLTGLSEEQHAALMEHIMDSGRGYMRGAIVEDTADAVGPQGILGKIGNIVRTPFYAGENFQATATRITAYLDTVEKFPKLNVKSVEFWNEVQKRDRNISFAMNSAQKSLAQSGSVSKVITQWTAYPLRAMETIFFNDGLTAVERARLGLSQAFLWGFAGMGGYGLGTSMMEGYPEWARDLVVKGIGDTILSNTVGIELGSRIGLNPVSLIERGYATFMDPTKTIPALNIGAGTAGSALDAVVNFASGRWAMASHDLETLVRGWKIVDNPIMAYHMMMEDVRRSRAGVETEGPFTSSQEFFQAIGFNPSNTLDEQNIRNLVFDIKEKQKLAISTTLPYTKQAFEAIQNGDYAAGEQLLADVDVALQGYGLTNIELREAKEELMNSIGFDKVNYQIGVLMKAGYEDLAEKLAENN